jgi:predicted nucleic acid-binding protein
MFLLDTNVISELRAGKRSPSAAVRSWAAGVPSNQLYLSSVTVMELEMGVLGMERSDREQGSRLRFWLEAVLEQFSPQILPFGKEAAVLCAAIHIPNRRSERDAMIAATAKEHGYTVVTRNTDDFDSCGVLLLNPWLTVA